MKFFELIALELQCLDRAAKTNVDDIFENFQKNIQLYSPSHSK